MIKPLEKQLRQIVPQATVQYLTRMPWHSVTFCGAQLSFEMLIETGHHSVDEEKIADELGTAEFFVPGHFVADIAVVEQSRSDRLTRLVVLVLVLEA